MNRALALAALGLALTASPALAQSDDDPDALFLAAARAYGDEDYERAAELFARVYALRPETSLLLNRGRACERAGMAAEAVEAYEAYLEAAPDADDRPDVERSLETLRRQVELEAEVAEREAATREAATAVAQTPPAPPPDGDAGPPSGPVPWIVLGAGGAALVTGIILGALASGRYGEATDSPTLSGARTADLVAEAQGLGTAANVLFGVGAGLALVGLTWGLIELLVSGSSDDEAAVSLGPWRWSLQ